MNFICAVCNCNLFEIQRKANLSSTPCGHVFHDECLDAWLVPHKNCPECDKRCRRGKVVKLCLLPVKEEKPALDFGPQLNGLNNKMDQIAGMMESFGVAMASWRSKSEDQTKENSELKNKISELEAEISCLKKELGTAKIDLETDEAIYKNLEETIFIYQEENQKLRAQINNMNNKNRSDRPRSINFAELFGDDSDDDSWEELRSNVNKKRKLSE
jgi:predicted RNase H-like nuclease (RuvC/YqgF family)